MNIWFTSDEHLGHANIIKYEKRPFKDIFEMKDALITNFNERVKEEDLTYHLGDFCFKAMNDRGNGYILKPDSYIKQLNGRHIFIRGNHDSKNGLKTKNHSIVISMGGRYINLVHRPLDTSPTYSINLVGHIHSNWKVLSFNAYYNQQKKNLEKKCPLRYKQNVQAFVKKWQNHQRNSLLINVGVDVHNFKPITFNEIMKIYATEMKSKKV